MAIVLTHPARAALEEYNHAHPGIFKDVAQVRAKESRSWAAEIFLPTTAASLIQGKHFSLADRIRYWGTDEFARQCTLQQMFAAWRTTQGIYRFDPQMYADLIRTPHDGTIPAEILKRLPQWCVYFETPGRVVTHRGAVHEQLGAWAFLDCLPGQKSFEQMLVFGVHTTSGIFFIPLPMVGTVDQSMKAYAQIRKFWGGGVLAADQVRTAANTAKHLLSVLLYLCSEQPELGVEGAAPQRPELRCSKGMERINLPSQPRVWDVGVRMGSVMRRAHTRKEALVAAYKAAGGKGMCPHFRRAHWAHRWVGKRNGGDRRLELRWIPPTLVNAKSPDDLASVIIPVEPELDS